MNNNNQLISELEQAKFAIALTISTLKGEADPRQLHLLAPPPHIDIIRQKDCLNIIVKINDYF